MTVKNFTIPNPYNWPISIPIPEDGGAGFNNKGFASFTDGGSGEGHDFVTVALANPFLPGQIPYRVGLTVIRTDGGPIPTVAVTAQNEIEFVISTTALGTFLVSWETNAP